MNGATGGTTEDGDSRDRNKKAKQIDDDLRKQIEEQGGTENILSFKDKLIDANPKPLPRDSCGSSVF